MSGVIRLAGRSLLAMISVGAALAPAVEAQSAESLEAAVVDFYEKLNNEDPSFAEYYLPGTQQFPRTGLLLQPNQGPAEATVTLESGLDFEVQIRHLTTRVFGDTGIVTYYTVGSTTYPDGVVLNGTYRGSLVAVWEGNRWQWAHGHFSELKSEP